LIYSDKWTVTNFPTPHPTIVTPRTFYAANECRFNVLFAVSTGELQMFSEFYLVAFVRNIILAYDKLNSSNWMVTGIRPSGSPLSSPVPDI